MQALNIEQTYRVLLGDVNRFRIMVVGCGGTGSSLALALAGLAYHARQKGIQVELTLVDDDVIEARNVGRQSFAAGGALAGGIPKATDLALRLNAAYGLAIEAWPQRYTAGMAAAWFRHEIHRPRTAHLLVGCVDNHQGRRELARTVEDFHGRVWALDCGNEQVSGQVFIGNLSDPRHIRLDPLGLCSGLPSPYVQEPALLEPDPDEQRHSCAEQALAEPQSLMVNRLVAAVAAQYATTFVLQRQVVQLGSVFSLEPTVMAAKLITAASLAPYTEQE